MFLRAALHSEQPERVLALRDDLGERLPMLTQVHWGIETALYQGEIDAAREALLASGLPHNGQPFHELSYRIALRAGDLSEALAQLKAIERLVGRCPLEHFLAQFALFKQLGRYDLVTRTIDHLLPQLPPNPPALRWQLRLWMSGIRHAEGRFAESQQESLALIAEARAAIQPQGSGDLALAAPWTRRRQHQVIADLGSLIAAQRLPLCLSSGSLLALAREGDFFISDKDVDLAVLDAPVEAVASRLIASGLFQPADLSENLMGYQPLRHRPTGLAVDLTQYASTATGWVIHWRDGSGAVVREARCPPFEARESTALGGCGQVPIPHPWAGYLTAVYGDWRTPDPSFDTVVMAKNLTGLTPFLISLGLLRLAHALFSRRPARARALAAHLRHSGLTNAILENIDD